MTNSKRLKRLYSDLKRLKNIQRKRVSRSRFGESEEIDEKTKEEAEKAKKEAEKAKEEFKEAQKAKKEAEAKAKKARRRMIVGGLVAAGLATAVLSNKGTRTFLTNSAKNTGNSIKDFAGYSPEKIAKRNETIALNKAIAEDIKQQKAVQEEQKLKNNLNEFTAKQLKPPGMFASTATRQAFAEQVKQQSVKEAEIKQRNEDLRKSNEYAEQMRKQQDEQNQQDYNSRLADAQKASDERNRKADAKKARDLEQAELRKQAEEEYNKQNKRIDPRSLCEQWQIDSGNCPGVPKPTPKKSFKAAAQGTIDASRLNKPLTTTFKR